MESQFAQNAFNDFASSERTNIYRGGALPSFLEREETRGTRFLFGKWVKGFVVNANNVIISNDSFYFNFNKISQSLLVTIDKKTVIEVDNREYNSVTFQYDDSIYRFEHAPVIEDKKFYLVLVKSENYSLYKLIITKFKGADYFTDGIYETGNKYDEYVDLAEYYIVFPDKHYSKLFVPLRKKNIKHCFTINKDYDAVESYLSKNKYDAVDETLLIKLIDHLNSTHAK